VHVVIHSDVGTLSGGWRLGSICRGSATPIHKKETINSPSRWVFRHGAHFLGKRFIGASLPRLTNWPTASRDCAERSGTRKPWLGWGAVPDLQLCGQSLESSQVEIVAVLQIVVGES
jgi:hypothetical protein